VRKPMPPLVEQIRPASLRLLSRRNAQLVQRLVNLIVEIDPATAVAVHRLGRWPCGPAAACALIDFARRVPTQSSSTTHRPDRHPVQIEITRRRGGWIINPRLRSWPVTGKVQRLPRLAAPAATSRPGLACPPRARQQAIPSGGKPEPPCSVALPCTDGIEAIPGTGLHAREAAPLLLATVWAHIPKHSRRQRAAQQATHGSRHIRPWRMVTTQVGKLRW